jgi:hypothetical protein
LSAALADPRELAREKKVLEERINRLSQMGVRTDVAPKKPQEGKVTAVAPEVGLVVISIGKDDGNFEGDEFTVYRGGDFVAKIQLDRADRRWAAGKIVLKKSDPRVGDDVSNHLYVNAQGKLLTRPAAGMEEVEVQPAGEGQVALKADGWTNLQKGRVFSISRDRKFVAIVRIIEGDGKQARAAIVKTLSIGQPQAGDKGRLVIDLGTFLATLPDETRQDLASRRSLAEMRVKMGY